MRYAAFDVEKIKRFMEERGYSMARFAEVCGIGINVLKKVFANDFRISIIAVSNIAKTMKLHLDDLFID